MASARAVEWLRVGAELGERYAANEDIYAAAGYETGAAYRLAFVRANWPNIGPAVKRYIRDGFNAVSG
jgi:hypothetical protein